VAAALHAKTYAGSPLSPVTIGQARRILHCCLNAAVTDGLIAVNPVTAARLPKTPAAAGERHTFSREQFHTLLAAFPARYHLAPVVMGYCGLRWGEVSALRLRHFDRDKRLLRVEETLTEVGGRLAADTPKSAASTRTIPLPDPVYKALLEHLQTGLDGLDSYLFTTVTGQPVGYRTFRRFGWDVAARAAELPAELTPHCLRHSYATWMLEAGAPIQTVRKMLGHASLLTTQIYAHSTTEADKAASDRLINLLTG
jgi:integrase